MTNTHPNENEIQNYILDDSSNSELFEHMLHCKNCSSKADQYKQLFAAIHRQEAAAFEFNLTKMVMEQLPLTSSKFSFDKYFNHIIAAVVFIVCLGLLYFINPLLTNMLSNVTPILTGLIATVVACISAGSFLDMFRKHNEQMGVVNLY